MGEVVADYLNKGGSTKTTTEVHLCHAFALEGLRVLSIDTDGQQQTSRWLHPGAAPKRTLRDVAVEPESIREVIVQTRIPGVDLIYASQALPMIAESVLKMSSDGQPRNPYRVLKKAVSFVRDDYDVILIDCAPGITLLNTNALVACDHVLVPLDVSDMSYEGLESLIGALVQMASGDEKILDALPPVSVLLTKTETNESKGIEVLRQRIAALASDQFSAFQLLQNSVRYRKQVRTDLYHERLDAFDRAQSKEFKYSHLKAVADDYGAVAREFATLLMAQMQKKREGVA